MADAEFLEAVRRFPLRCLPQDAAGSRTLGFEARQAPGTVDETIAKHERMLALPQVAADRWVRDLGVRIWWDSFFMTSVFKYVILSDNWL